MGLNGVLNYLSQQDARAQNDAQFQKQFALQQAEQPLRITNLGLVNQELEGRIAKDKQSREFLESLMEQIKGVSKEVDTKRKELDKAAAEQAKNLSPAELERVFKGQPSAKYDALPAALQGLLPAISNRSTPDLALDALLNSGPTSAQNSLAARYRESFSPQIDKVPQAAGLGGIAGFVASQFGGGGPSVLDAPLALGGLGADVAGLLGRGAIAPFVGYDYAGLPGRGNQIASDFNKAVDAFGAINPLQGNPGYAAGAALHNYITGQRDPREQAAIDANIAAALKARGGPPGNLSASEINDLVRRIGQNVQGFAETAGRR